MVNYPEISASLDIKDNFTYANVKASSIKYSEASTYLRNDFFKVWTKKPKDLNSFTV